LRFPADLTDPFTTLPFSSTGKHLTLPLTARQARVFIASRGNQPEENSQRPSVSIIIYTARK
jgi:hypothetical protein